MKFHFRSLRCIERWSRDAVGVSRRKWPLSSTAATLQESRRKMHRETHLLQSSVTSIATCRASEKSSSKFHARQIVVSGGDWPDRYMRIELVPVGLCDYFWITILGQDPDYRVDSDPSAAATRRSSGTRANSPASQAA